MKNIEKIASDRGYIVTVEGDALNRKGLKVGRLSSKKLYLEIGIKVANKVHNCSVHRLQAYQKYGDSLYMDGMVVRHLNDIKTDNSWANIVIGTQKDNMQDIPEQVRIQRARNASSSLIKHDSESIKKFFAANSNSYRATMEHFNISSKGTLHYIVNKR